MTDTPEAVRLADKCETGYLIGPADRGAAAALLRHIPELEEDLAAAQSIIDGYRKHFAQLEAERDQLRAWQQAAFAAHPNIDLDIEAAITPPHADQKGQ